MKVKVSVYIQLCAAKLWHEIYALSQTCRKCCKMTFTNKTKTDQENKSRKTEKENVPLKNVAKL